MGELSAKKVLAYRKKRFLGHFGVSLAESSNTEAPIECGDPDSKVSNGSKKLLLFIISTRRQTWGYRSCVVSVEVWFFCGVIVHCWAMVLPLWIKNICFVPVYVVTMLTFLELFLFSHIIHPDHSFPFSPLSLRSIAPLFPFRKVQDSQ